MNQARLMPRPPNPQPATPPPHARGTPRPPSAPPPADAPSSVDGVTGSAPPSSLGGATPRPPTTPPPESSSSDDEAPAMELGGWNMEPEPSLGRARTDSMDSTGDDLDFAAFIDDFDPGSFLDDKPGSFLDEQAVTEEFEQSMDREVSLDGELTRTMSTFMRSTRAVSTVDRVRSGTLDGEVVDPSGDEPEPEPEPEPQQQPEPAPAPGGYMGGGPRIDPVRVKRAAQARAAPSWQDDVPGGQAACMWCDVLFNERTWQQHCRRCGWAVCDGCSPHRQVLDVWLDGKHPHAVKYERSGETLRVCAGCARAGAHAPRAEYYLATMSRISDQITVRQVGPSRADALAGWEDLTIVDTHALFELQPGATAAVIKSSWLIRDQTVDILKTEVEDAAAAQQDRAKAGPPLAKTAQMWLDSPSRTERKSVWSAVSLDYRNFTITVTSAAATAAAEAEASWSSDGADSGGAESDQLARQKSYAVVRQSVSTDSVLIIHCGDCRTVVSTSNLPLPVTFWDVLTECLWMHPGGRWSACDPVRSISRRWRPGRRLVRNFHHQRQARG